MDREITTLVVHYIPQPDTKYDGYFRAPVTCISRYRVTANPVTWVRCWCHNYMYIPQDAGVPNRIPEGVVINYLKVAVVIIKAVLYKNRPICMIQ